MLFFSVTVTETQWYLENDVSVSSSQFIFSLYCHQYFTCDANNWINSSVNAYHRTQLIQLLKMEKEQFVRFINEIAKPFWLWLMVKINKSSFRLKRVRRDICLHSLFSYSSSNFHYVKIQTFISVRLVIIIIDLWRPSNRPFLIYSIIQHKIQ